MRFWEWGRVYNEHPDWHWDNYQWRSPWGPTGDNADYAEFNANSYPPTIGDDAIGYWTYNGGKSEFLGWILKDQIKAKLGQVPIIVVCRLMLHVNELAGTATYPLEAYRMFTVWDKGDVTNYRYDKSADLWWHQRKHYIIRGYDCEATPSHSATQSHVYGNKNTWFPLPLTNIVIDALRKNHDIRFLLVSKYSTGWSIDLNSTEHPERNPYLFFAYLYPIEFYHDDGSGTLDLSSPVTDEPEDEYYIGAVEPGQTSTAEKLHIKNFSSSVQQVEIFDDHAEYTDPVTKIGNAKLDYVDLAEAAVSQMYTVTFYSATQYEVKAEAYRDNSISLHPQINGDATWRGDITTQFTAPSGGLIIPAEAWQPGTVLGDEYEVGVRGNTTDTAWVADANDQVQITFDNAGNPDTTGWRPITGHRELTTAEVTVDATTKFFPTRRVIAAQWPADTKAFVMNATTINHGEVSSVQEASIGTPTFTGTGSDDITISGNYNGAWTADLYIEIDGTSTPNTFKWSIDGGATFEATGVNLSTTPILLQDGIYVQWAATTGHNSGDNWNTAVASWGITLKNMTANSNVYGARTRIATTLPLRDVSASVYTTVASASGVSQGIPSRLYVEFTTGFSAGQDIFVQSPNSPDTAETIEIDSVGTGYIDLVASMTQDYEEGDFVVLVGTGDRAFWARVVASPTTVEQRKDFRLNARML